MSLQAGGVLASCPGVGREDVLYLCYILEWTVLFWFVVFNDALFFEILPWRLLACKLDRSCTLLFSLVHSWQYGGSLVGLEIVVKCFSLEG